MRIPPVAIMGDETFMNHMHLRHSNDLSVEPRRTEGELADPSLWRTYHETKHRLDPHSYDHEHNEE